MLSQHIDGKLLDSVQTVKNKLNDFEKSAAAQEEKVKSLEQIASKLVASGHFATDDIRRHINLVIATLLLFVFFFLIIGFSYAFTMFGKHHLQVSFYNCISTDDQTDAKSVMIPYYQSKMLGITLMFVH